MKRWPLLILLGGAQCTPPTPASPSATHGSPAPSTVTTATAFAPLAPEPAAPVEPQPTLTDLRRAVRAEQWAKAAEIVPAVPLSGAASHYLKARIALELGQFDQAMTQLEPLLEAEHLRPFAEADLRRARGRSGKLDGIGVRARTLLDGGDLLWAARVAVDARESQRAGVLIAEAAKHLRGRDEAAAELHALRARWALAAGQPYRAFVDFRWLATRKPASPFAEGALESLTRHFPKYRLSKSEWMQRIDALAQAGQSDRLSAEFASFRASHGNAVDSALELHHLGWAQYEQRDFDRAAHTLAAAAAASSRYAVRDEYYAGQAHSRVGRHGEAAEAFRRLLARSPKGTFAELAALRIAQQHSFAGQWSAAVGAYTSFIDHHAHSEELETALRERAVARYGALELERAAFEWKRLRALRPASPLAPLYRHLEALSLLGTPRAGEAIALFETTRAERPLSFEGLMARQRLKELAQPVPPLDPPPPDAASISLPPLVDELEGFGLFRESERVMTALEAEFAAAAAIPRAELHCRAHAKLYAGRRRLLLGQSAANATSFYSRPADAPRWVWDCLYPTPYVDWVREHAASFGVPPALVFAVMRQESGFRPDVASPADAHGLMQIIPPTAREIALGLGEPSEGIDLYNPALNVRYGTYYLGLLQQSFGPHPALAAAAYNAGPEALGMWFAAGQELPLELFVARIPYDETRTYVMRVLANLAAYQLLDADAGAIDIPLALR